MRPCTTFEGRPTGAGSGRRVALTSSPPPKDLCARELGPHPQPWVAGLRLGPEVLGLARQGAGGAEGEEPGLPARVPWAPGPQQSPQPAPPPGRLLSVPLQAGRDVQSIND